MKLSKRKPVGIAHRRVNCPECGKSFESSNFVYEEMCPGCKAKHGIVELFASPASFGEIICWKDGKEYEKLSCMERKHHAIQRAMEGKDYDMPWCARCGASEAMTPIESPCVENETASRKGRPSKSFIMLCARCGRKTIAYAKSRKYCNACARTMQVERDRNRRKNASKTINR